MKKIKVSEATGKVLDWLVAKCEGWRAEAEFVSKGMVGLLYPPEAWKQIDNSDKPGDESLLAYWDFVSLSDLTYSTDWVQGGPIIEREQISIVGANQVEAPGHPYPFRFESFFACMPKQYVRDDFEGGRGPTHLIAAMRCWVCHKLGDEVEVPEGLL